MLAGDLCWLQRTGLSPDVLLSLKHTLMFWVVCVSTGTLEGTFLLQFAALSAASRAGWSLVDVLSASYADDTIAWYENDGGSPPSWTAYTITTSADAARCVFATDVDGDGDVDVLSASSNDDTIAW